MNDDYGTTNPARAARESADRLRGELPTAPPGSLAEQMGYPSIDDVSPTIAKALGLRALGERQAWLQERRTGLGASDIAVIMGWSTFDDTSEWKVWGQKVGLLPAGDADDNELFRYGRMAEPMLRRYYQEETGLYVGGEQELRRHPDIPIALATIDGEVYDHEFDPHWQEAPEPLGGVEFKTTRDAPSKWEAHIPDYYQCQGQWQMAVCGWSFVDFAVLHGFMFRVYRLERDQADIDLLLARGQEWWDAYVVTQEPPPVDGSSATAKALRDIYPGRVKNRVQLEMHTTAALLREAKVNKKKWEESVAVLENQIKEAMGDATDAQLGEGWTASWSRFGRTTIDSKALKAKFPDAYDVCAKTSPTSRFTLKDPAGDNEEEQF